jgi:hypothetical protein
VLLSAARVEGHLAIGVLSDDGHNGGMPGRASVAAHADKAGKPLILLAVAPLWGDFFSTLDGALARAMRKPAVA